MRTAVLLLLLGGLCFSDAVMVCYYGSWAVWRPGKGRFDVDDIDPFLCTHLVFGFAGLSKETWEIKVLDPYNELCDNWGRCAFERFVTLKEVNPKLKILLAVGGWTEGSINYSQMAADPAKRKTFIESSIALLKSHDFDGFDIDWEYPAGRGGSPADKTNFIQLLTELRAALDEEGMMLTAAVSAGVKTMEAGYDIPAMSRLLDMINVMAYDMHGAWETFTHHNAPLYAHPADAGDNKTLSVDYAINYYLDHGADPAKIIMGIPTYGRCYTLDNLSNNGYYASASTPGHAGPYTRTAGTLGYNEICEFMKETGKWVVVNDPAMHEPYAYYPGNKIWCGYDDAASVYVKAKYARAMGLGGTMTWSIETDDFHGVCNGRKFGLIKSMVEGFTGSDFVTVPPPTVPPTMEPVTGAPECVAGNYYIPDKHCEKYWHCVSGLPISGTCPPSLVWNQAKLTCSWPSHVDTSECIMPGTTDPPAPIPTVTDDPTKVPTKPPTMKPPTTKVPVPPTGAPPSCLQQGTYYIPHRYCNKFWQCDNRQAIEGTCAPGLLWNPAIKGCDWPVHVDTTGCIMP